MTAPWVYANAFGARTPSNDTVFFMVVIQQVMDV